MITVGEWAKTVAFIGPNPAQLSNNAVELWGSVNFGPVVDGKIK